MTLPWLSQPTNLPDLQQPEAWKQVVTTAFMLCSSTFSEALLSGSSLRAALSANVATGRRPEVGVPSQYQTNHRQSARQACHALTSEMFRRRKR